jgi:transketolase
VRAAVRAAIDRLAPVYIRLGKKGEPKIHKELPEFTLGRAITIRPGEEVCILSCGTPLPSALDAADLLQKSGVNPAVASFHTVKPLDEECLRKVFTSYRIVVTWEEHSIMGGFGSAVAEWYADNAPLPAKLVRIGTPDSFLYEAADKKHAFRLWGLDTESVARRISDALLTNS